MRNIISVLVLFLVFPFGSNSQSITSVNPSAQRVHDYIELIGSDFGNSQGNSLVSFTDGTDIWSAGTAYIWRDNYIKIRVPVGKQNGGSTVPMSSSPLQIYVDKTPGTSNTLTFQVLKILNPELEFRQLTNITGSHEDVSTVLGAPNLNSARTKDAEVADINYDGWPDLTDNNSNNEQNNSHSVLRLNARDKSFTAIKLEPLNSGDTGTFATEITPSGDFFEDHTSYDSDYADINGDRYPDLIQTAANNTGGSDHRIRLLINNRDNIPGQFSEETALRMPANAFGSIGCPDDIDHVDMDQDGDIDFAVTLRTSVGFCDGETSEIRVFENTGNGFFAAPIIIQSRNGNSTHDVLWFDANHDGFYDIIAANEWNNIDFNDTDVQVQLFLNDGNNNFSENQIFNIAATTAEQADFNGDGLMDFVAGRTEVKVFLTRADSPCLTNPAAQCTFDEVVIQPSGGNNPFYDLEPGDINNDGFVDIVGARILDNAENVPIYINDGSGTFTEITGGNSSTVLPDHFGTYQRLSADMLDFDLDGDLDLYLTGQDGPEDEAPSGSGFGRGPNQFYENLTIGLDIVYPKSGNAAYAGSATGGRKVLINIRANVVVEDLVPSDFIIKVNDVQLDPSATVTGSQIEQEYWLLVQMPANADGLYSLEVALADDPLIADIELGALEYAEERLFDRSLSIDRTTSMLYNSVTEVFETEKMDAAKAAANFFINLSEDSDKIAVTSFKRNLDDGDGIIEQNEMARTDWTMTDAFDTSTSTDNRGLAIDIVNNMQPDGTYFPYQTTIGAGLVEALTELQDNGNTNHEWEMVLLSDGIENLAPFWKKVESGPPIVLPIKPNVLAADPNVRVHTVAVGQDADALLLMEIADETGGQFFNLYEGTASYGLISRLASVYKYIDEEMRGEQRFHYKEEVPDPIIIQKSPFNMQHNAVSHQKLIRVDSLYVPNGFESISVGFHWNKKFAIEQVVLYDPNLVAIPPNPPVQTIQYDPSHKIYKIRDPQPGWYYYTVELGTTDPFEFMIIGSGITDLLALGKKGTISEISPGFYQIPLRVVVGDSEPVLFCNVSGDVVLPDKTHVAINLKDDGVHEDGRNSDAIYGELFKHSMPGGYFANITVAGVSSLNETFTRHLYLSWTFPGLEQDPDEPEETDDPNDGGLTNWPGGDPKNKDILWGFHVGSSHPLGKFNSYADANIHLRLDATYSIKPHLNAVLMAGFSQFTTDFSSGLDNTWWTNLSVNAQIYTNMSSGWFSYAQAGSGYYWKKSGSGSNVGMNIGVGGIVPLASGPFAIRFGVDYHRVFNDNNVDYLTAQLGVMWRVKNRTKRNK
ncbi:FG-GAP-like repeat-containing protein [Aquimarina intermedia]|uniref:von Willebrand factor type A domain-containing protein n=1 Tax=Aquimarina intermedia TaxID=350814 RepID=A0A5S5CA76_9FLAO|nr:FG-GAP-like repeat-containing protein [Aquimarina intermedia]TYP75266.1 von Willebrand factor type A domain-containing protein [Aquimarina intermedia]